VFNNALGHLGPLSVLVVGGWLVIRGETQVGTIVAFVSGYEKLMNPARDLLNLYRQYSQMRVQYRLIRQEVNEI
jgi:ABC-type bacteriocin/lantibiotic exporter with double-glycine peptidase domain